MNLEELKLIVDNTIEHLHGEDTKNIPILITLSESSMGARSSTSVKYASMGFDEERVNELTNYLWDKFIK